MTPIPTVIRMPARTPAGILEAMVPSTRIMLKRNTPAIMPDSRVLPPELILTTVLIVAPAPGRPPKNAATVFPIPWPINSWLGLCCVLVMLSATREVRRESIAPSIANVKADKIKGDMILKSMPVKIS